jgi:bifunctional non-homologous end joining protein LigD
MTIEGPCKRLIDMKRARTKPRGKPLTDYAGKRDFARTPEPRPEGGEGAAGSAGAAREFVVQKHAARRLHYDLRLELDGTLKSWAVTRGPSLALGEKRLAVRTEDHPVAYLDFEGNIPKGEYGGGSMIVWDRGRWVPEGDPRIGLEKGHLAFRLDGARLKGRWHLVRIKPQRGRPRERTEPWLLMKAEDEFARAPGAPEITDEETTSYLSGRTNQELAAEGALREDHKARISVAKARKILLPDIGKVRGARKGLLPTFLEPSAASPCDKPPSGPRWIHEIKHDGYRIQARIDGRNVRLLTRKGIDWTERFRGIADALKELGFGSALIDGEIVVEDAAGLSSLNDLQMDLKEGRQDRLRYFAFDLLYCEGYDLTPAILLDRKAALQQILSSAPPPIRFGEHLEIDGPMMLEHSCRLGLEGIISKRADLPYRGGHGDHWLKAKCRAAQEFVILGFIPSTAASRSVGSLALGYHADGKLAYAGRVGTGWSAAQAASLYADLAKIKSVKPALKKPLPAGAEKDVVWCEPRLVCEVEFRDWTHDELIRQSSFKGLREDKSAEEIILETRARPTAPKSAAPQRAAPKASKPAADVDVRLTHPERILWPEPGITKQGLADFYAEIADWILPHITGRVLSLLRCPSGTAEKCFFAKHAWARLSEVVRRVPVGEKDPMLAIDDLAGLLNLVQAGVVEIHPWGSRIDRLEHPDRLIFDLDPGDDVPWSTVIVAAQDVRDRLLALGLKSFVKTSGGKGLHVVVPVEPLVGWEQAKSFTASIADAMARDRPDRYVATMSKRARHGRILVDYFRNHRGATAVAAYSTRNRAQASVSTPLAWDELSEGLKSDHFTVGNLRHRLGFLRQDPWPGFFTLRQRIPADR